jgi:hypothetical protein
MKKRKSDLIARAVAKRDKTRVALRKTACGAVLIDGLTFSFGVESDGAASSKGIVLAVSGEAVEKGDFKLDMIDVIYPAGGGTKQIKRKAEYYKKNDGKHIFRAKFPEIKIKQCADTSIFSSGAQTEEELLSSMNNQIIFKFVPHYAQENEAEIMINIYPLENPLDGNCTEWKPATSDREFFEHGGLSRIK